MEYGGKITQRFWMPKQLGVDDVLAHEIRATASADRRELRDQLRFLIELGLEHRRLKSGQELLSQTAHTDAHDRNGQTQPSTAAHTDAHGQLPLTGTAGPVLRKRKTA